MSHRLVWRFTAAIGSVVAVSIVLTGAAQIYFGYREMQQSVATRLTLEATRAASRIDAAIEHTANFVEATARIIEVQQGLGSSMAQETLYQLLKVPRVVDAWKIDADGREKAHISIFDTDSFDSNRDVSGDQRFVAAGDGRPSFGPLYFYNGSVPMMTVSVRIPDGQVIAAAVSLKHMHNVIADLQIGRTGQAYVVAQSGDLIAHRSLDKMLGRVNLARAPQVARALANDSPDVIKVGQGTADSGFLLFSEVEGKQMVSTWTPLKVPGWTLIVEQDRSEAFAPVWEEFRSDLLFFTVSLVLGLIASIFMARQVVAPISRLRDGADQIGAGNLAHRISIRGGDEIGELADRFNAMAEKLQSLYETLDTKVQMRTAALMETTEAVHRKSREVVELNAELQARMLDLGERKAEAERANAAKSRFLAAASHDLRQPMHTIELLVGLLKTRAGAGEPRVLIDSIQSSVRVLASLFNSLLDLSRLDRGTLQPRIEIFRVAELLRAVRVTYEPQAVAKGLRFRIAPCKALVRSDFSLLERVLGNLISNAINCTARGTILIGCRRRGDSVAIQVIDTGCGIPEDRLDEIFDEFVQLDNPERDRSKGLGLGLAIVERTARLLDHRIAVKSRIGHGSTFGVEVPTVPGNPALPDSDAPDADDQASLSIAGARIVVIDDDASAALPMAALLRSWGAEVVMAESEFAALARLRETGSVPDLIVSDYRLRDERTGVMAIEAIRAYAGEVIPALIVTGDLLIPAPGQVLPAKTIVMHKPISLDQFRVLASQLYAQRCAALELA